MPTKAELERENSRLKYYTVLFGILTLLFGSGGIFGVVKWFASDRIHQEAKIDLINAQKKHEDAQSRLATLEAEQRKIDQYKIDIAAMQKQLSKLETIDAEKKVQLDKEIEAKKKALAASSGNYQRTSKTISIDNVPKENK